jgi:hypothetical protein
MTLPGMMEKDLVELSHGGLQAPGRGPMGASQRDQHVLHAAFFVLSALLQGEQEHTRLGDQAPIGVPHDYHPPPPLAALGVPFPQRPDRVLHEDCLTPQGPAVQCAGFFLEIDRVVMQCVGIDRAVASGKARLLSAPGVCLAEPSRLHSHPARSPHLFQWPCLSLLAPVSLILLLCPYPSLHLLLPPALHLPFLPHLARTQLRPKKAPLRTISTPSCLPVPPVPVVPCAPLRLHCVLVQGPSLPVAACVAMHEQHRLSLPRVRVLDFSKRPQSVRPQVASSPHTISFPL